MLCKLVNVLSKTDEQQNLLLDLNSKINDEDLNSTYLNKLRILLAKQNEASNTIQPTIILHKTLERFNKSKKEVTIQDLQLEI